MVAASRPPAGTALYCASFLAALASLGLAASSSSTETLRVSAHPGHDRMAGQPRTALSRCGQKSGAECIGSSCGPHGLEG